MIWVLIAVLTLGTVAAKTLGPVLAGGRQPPERVRLVIAMLAPALITSLVVTGTVTTGHHVVMDVRLAGVGAGLLALLLRAPLVVALVIAAGTAAGLRLLG
jgi:branched chain amino acid efflux pump